MTNTINVREDDSLTLDKKVSETKGANKISPKDFKFLAKLDNPANLLLKEYYEENETKDPPKIVRWVSAKKLRIQNYVGMVWLPSKVFMEILPKVQIVPNDEYEKQKLIEMIVHTLTPRISEKSQFLDDRNTLMEYIIWWFLRLMDDVVKKGIKQNYVLKQENSTFVKGKILFSQHILHNAALQHRTFIEYEDYTPNCIENRALHSALWVCVKRSRHPDNKRKAIRYCHMFDGIDKIRRTDDLHQWRENPYYQHYNDIKPLVKIILNGIQPFMTQGKQEIPAVLFPMEIVYEKYIACCLEKYKNAYEVKTQSTDKHLTTDKNFTLKPDIVMTHKETNKKTVLDTKWKRYKQGINQRDAYQMFAYSQAYDADVILLYPKSYNATQADTDPHTFEHGCTKTDNAKYTLKTHLTDLNEAPKDIAEKITEKIEKTL